jgi:branched-chain amino acid transport system permease protein
MTYWAATVISGLILAGIYALTGLGFVIIYKATGVFNFAQGQLLMAAAYLFYLFQHTMGWNIALAVVAVLISMAIIGLLAYHLILRPLAARPMFSSVIATLGISILISSACALKWGPNTLFVKQPWSGRFVTLHAGLRVTVYDVFSFGATLVLFGVFIALFRWTGLGLRMRAAATNALLAAQRGINLNSVYGLTWALGAVTAGAAGMLYAGQNGIDQNIALLGIGAFPAALIGGFDSVAGVGIGAVVVGVSQSIGTAIFGADTTQVVAAVILAVVLLIRPQGIFGSKEVTRL